MVLRGMLLAEQAAGLRTELTATLMDAPMGGLSVLVARVADGVRDDGVHRGIDGVGVQDGAEHAASGVDHPGVPLLGHAIDRLRVELAGVRGEGAGVGGLVSVQPQALPDGQTMPCTVMSLPVSFVGAVVAVTLPKKFTKF